MGVPQFFRYICERYPCILEKLRESKELDIDNFYVDMNGIIHSCSHIDDQEVNFVVTEGEIFKNIFNFLDVLFNVIKPQKVLFLAVDGVAPRAKINQQRQRRFKAAKDYEIQQSKLQSEHENLPDNPRFDPNCITPGTEFMAKLQTQLEYYVTQRISFNPLWQNCKVILSGHEVPGEGEHKIMEYIRYLKTLPEYDPYARHCFYGLDADLVMLGLSSDEYNVVILREDKCGNRKKSIVKPHELKFFMIHLPLLREYLDLEFEELKTTLPFDYNLENIVADWILMGFTLGNDFIPHLPDFHIYKGALPILYKTYKKVLPTLDGYMNERGYLNLPRFHAFLKGLAKYELELFEEKYTDLSYFEEKLDGKLNFGKLQNKDEDTPRDSDLRAFDVSEDVDSIDNGLIDEMEDYEQEENEDNEGDFMKHFWEQRRYYYENKLKFSKITEDVLQSQAECYIRGLQWTLHYYYHGCKSWTWFYPYNYAPYISDILNFKDFNLEFELGRPFLPYEQLLAVLPPGSKDLIPKAYQHLMTSPSSPIIHYYPETFETDLNGKRFEWQAIALLPYINETELLKAMEGCNDELTPEEKSCNKHSPMLIYSYTSKNLGPYIAPQYGTNIASNHALVEAVWRHEIAVDSSKIKRLDDVDFDIYFPGYPTFKFINFEATRKKGRVNAFGFQGANEKILITIKKEEKPQLEKLATELLGKIVYVDWPYLTEARVVAVAENNVKYSVTDKGPEKYQMSEEEKSKLYNSTCYIRRHYLDKKGIDIGNTRIIVSANIIQGVQYNFNSSNKLICNKVWSEITEYFPLQTLVKHVKVDVSRSGGCIRLKDPFPVNSIVFMLACPYYGCMGRIRKASDKSKNGRVLVGLEVPSEHKIDKKLLNQSNAHYYTASAAGLQIGITPALVGRISGKIFVNLAAPGKLLDKSSIINIGLVIKLNKIDLEIPGYTKKDSCWKYSNKAIAVMKEYVERYPHVVEYLSSLSGENCVHPRADIFPGPNGVEEIMDMLFWINSLECKKIKPVPCGSKLVDTDVVAKLEKIIDNFPKKSSVKNLFVKPQLLFKSEFKSKGQAPVPTAEHQLLDRVIFVKPDNIIPLGLRGYIIGIHGADSPDDFMYDILCDEPLTCSHGRRFITSKMSFINISHGERTYQLTKQSKINQLEFSRSTNPPVLMGKERSPSTFAQWNNYPPAQLSPSKGDQFKTLWSYLEKVKSQDETEVLKKLLKIEEDDKPKDIEENVKRFFENVSESAGKMIARSPGGEILLRPYPQPEQRFSSQLLQYFHSRNLPSPTYQSMELGNKVIFQVSLPNGRVYTGFPSKIQDCARDSAALQALIALSEIHPADDYSKDCMRNRKIQEDHVKLEKGLVKNGETDSLKSHFKSQPPNDNLAGSNNCKQQNHRKNNVPHTLPTPPLKWCRQYKNSSDSYGDQMKNSGFNSGDDHNWRSKSLPKNESSKSGRTQNKNLNHYNMRLDSPTSVRCGNWREEEKARNQNWEFQYSNDYPKNGNWRSNQGQGQSNSCLEHCWRSDQRHSSSQGGTVHENNQQGGGYCQTPFVIATKFIPLQALSRNRSRSKTEQTQNKSLKDSKETGKGKAPHVASKLPTRPVEDEKLVSSRKVHRKSKIAAKFDAHWD